MNLNDSIGSSKLPKIQAPQFKMDFRSSECESPETKSLVKALKMQEKVLANLQLKDKL